MLLIAAISILAIGANLPADLASALGISQLALIVSLGFLVAVSLLNYAFRLLPMGIEEPEVPAPGADESRHAMFAALSKGDLATLHQLLAMNADVNFALGGTTPIHLATEKGDSEIVRTLIRHGANFRMKGADGRRPLEIALTKRFVRTTEILFEANKPYFANPEQTVNWRMNAGVWRDAEDPSGAAAGQA
ncbi:MAG: ankyrin repeat domain-containing protein [Nitrosomonadales bacterium]|nr:ankyrin repeat domain-containing protein [Nitrosomonadales bacterium]